MEELFFFALGQFIIYLVYVRVKYGMTKSISATYYELNNKWLFTITLWLFVMPFIIVGGKGLIFLAGASIAFVAAAPRVGDKYQISKWVHLIGSYLGIASGVVAMWVYYGLWWIPVIQLLFTLLAHFEELRHRTYWIEAVAIGLISYGLYLGELI